MFKEFKEFAFKGNVLDMAVGIIIGAAFTTVVKSLVDNVIMPPLGWLTKGINFADLMVSLDGTAYPSVEAAKTAGAPVLVYGQFIQDFISFMIVAFVVFLLVQKFMGAFKKPTNAPPPPLPQDVVLLTEIRDLLAQRATLPR